MEQLISSGTEISFAVLFVALLVWVMKKNDSRELRYQKTIDNLSESLKSNTGIEQKVDMVLEKMRGKG